jgi:hypothetical protein
MDRPLLIVKLPFSNIDTDHTLSATPSCFRRCLLYGVTVCNFGNWKINIHNARTIPELSYWEFLYFKINITSGFFWVWYKASFRVTWTSHSFQIFNFSFSALYRLKPNDSAFKIILILAEYLTLSYFLAQQL